MLQEHSTHEKGLKFLRSKKVVKLTELALHIDRSERTAQRRLADWRAITSYNRNGSFYTLPDIPKFDANGLWKYHGSFFSRFGNLPATFVQLVNNSQAGLTAAESGTLLGLRPSSFLWSLREHPALKREKHKGYYVYYSSSSTLFNSQKKQRNLMLKTSKIPTNLEVIAILVEKIKNPDLSNEDLSRRLKKKNVFVEPDAVQNLFVRHDLAEKKTPHSL